MTQAELREELDVHAAITRSVFSEMDERIHGLHGQLIRGVNNLDAFIVRLSRLEDESTMQLALMQRYDGRISALEATQ